MNLSLHNNIPTLHNLPTKPLKQQQPLKIKNKASIKFAKQFIPKVQTQTNFHTQTDSD